MKLFGIIFAAVVVTAIIWRATTAEVHNGKSQSAQPQPTNAVAKTAWSAQEIAKDPQGYLRWSDQQVQSQIAQREAHLRTLNDRRTQIAARRDELAQNLSDVKNIHDRLERAYRQADDEDRWPFKMAGHTFDRDKAKQILDQTQKYITDRSPLVQTYADSMAKMDQLDATLNGDIEKLKTLREKLALDLDSVQVNQGLDELTKVRSKEAELATMGKALSDMGKDPTAAAMPPPQTTGRVDVDAMLR